MRTTTWVIALVLAGCGASAGPEAAVGGSDPAAQSGGTVGTERAVAGATSAEPAAVAAEAGSAAPSEDLPAAPWASEPVEANAVPRALLAAWNGAENREWCAPLAPVSQVGTRARASRFDGGWAVEFDKRGMPGVTARGRTCRSCGRGAFGIAGTAVMVDDEDPTEAEELRWRDGSRVRIEVSEDEEGEPAEENGVVATIKIHGQDCVYQVWSFSGDEHLQELLHDLRFVDAN